MPRIPRTISERPHFLLPHRRRTIRISPGAGNLRLLGPIASAKSGSMAAGDSKSRVRLRQTFPDSWTISGSMIPVPTAGFAGVPINTATQGTVTTDKADLTIDENTGEP